MPNQTLPYAAPDAKPHGLRRTIAILCLVVAFTIATHACVRLWNVSPDMLTLWRGWRPLGRHNVWAIVMAGGALLTAMLAFGAVASLGLRLRHDRAARPAAILLAAAGIVFPVWGVAEVMMMTLTIKPANFTAVRYLIIEPLLHDAIAAVATVGLALLLHRSRRDLPDGAAGRTGSASSASDGV